jgi:hypothetical protein
MKLISRTLGRIAASTALILAAPMVHADPAHFWQYHVNGRYGYVQSQYVNACASVPWRDCKQPIIWYMFDGTINLSTLAAKRPKLAQFIAQRFGDNVPDQYSSETEIFLTVTPDPNHLVTGQGGMAHQAFVILDSTSGTWPTNAMLLDVYGNGSLHGAVHDLDRDSAAAYAFQDLLHHQISVSKPNASDRAEVRAIIQQAKQHPAPKHWWAYDIDGVYGYVKDPADPTCTPDWHLCKKPITWLLYNGERANGRNVFTVFQSPGRLASDKQTASPITFAVYPDGSRAMLSYLVTDGSAVDNVESIDYRSDLWFAAQDVAHDQVQPSSITVAEMNTLANQRQAFNQGRQAFMRRALEDYMNRQEIIVHTEP